MPSVAPSINRSVSRMILAAGASSFARTTRALRTQLGLPTMRAASLWKQKAFLDAGSPPVYIGLGSRTSGDTRIETIFLSLDGVMQGPGAVDEDTTDGFERGGWLVPHADADSEGIVNGWFGHSDAILLGRSTSLADDETHWQATTLVRGDAVIHHGAATAA